LDGCVGFVGGVGSGSSIDRIKKEKYRSQGTVGKQIK
jgi:hypothetical protein